MWMSSCQSWSRFWYNILAAERSEFGPQTFCGDWLSNSHRQEMSLHQIPQVIVAESDQRRHVSNFLFFFVYLFFFYTYIIIFFVFICLHVTLFHIPFLQPSRIFFYPPLQPNEIFFYIFSLQPSGIFFSSLSINRDILLHRCCFFRSNCDWIALCLTLSIPTKQHSNINYCILVCWRALRIR